MTIYLLTNRLRLLVDCPEELLHIGGPACNVRSTSGANTRLQTQPALSADEMAVCALEDVRWRHHLVEANRAFWERGDWRDSLSETCAGSTFFPQLGYQPSHLKYYTKAAKRNHKHIKNVKQIYHKIHINMTNSPQPRCPEATVPPVVRSHLLFSLIFLHSLFWSFPTFPDYPAQVWPASPHSD